MRRALEYLDGMAPEAGNDTALVEELAASYERVGDLQAGGDASLGDVAGAVASRQKAEGLRAIRLRAEPSADAAMKLARTRCRLATGLRGLRP